MCDSGEYLPVLSSSFPSSLPPCTLDVSLSALLVSASSSPTSIERWSISSVKPTKP